MSSDCPLARSEGLITEELDGELLVYDSESNLAHALDAEAAALWRACDGHTDAHTLAARCATSDDNVRITLARLGELGLLEERPKPGWRHAPGRAAQDNRGRRRPRHRPHDQLDRRPHRSPGSLVRGDDHRVPGPDSFERPLRDHGGVGWGAVVHRGR